MDAGEVELGPGQMYVVPRRLPHQPVTGEGADVVLIEPMAVDTGETPSDRTADRHVV